MFTDIFLQILIFETLLIGLVYTNCPNYHLQTEYCNNEIVFTAERPKTVSATGPYKMRILTIFKGESPLKSISEGNMVDMVSDVNFQKLTEGVLSGNKLIVFGKIKDGSITVDKCLRFYPLEWLTPYQKKALSDEYKLGCDCIGEIGTDYRNMRCAYEYASMVRVDGKCTWRKEICDQFNTWLSWMLLE